MKKKSRDLKETLDILNGVRGKHSPAQKNGRNTKPLDAIALLSLPERLRKTALAIHKKGRATALMIAAETGRQEPEERACLEQLAEMGLLKRDMTANEVYYGLSV